MVQLYCLLNEVDDAIQRVELERQRTIISLDLLPWLVPIWMQWTLRKRPNSRKRYNEEIVGSTKELLLKNRPTIT